MSSSSGAAAASSASSKACPAAKKSNSPAALIFLHGLGDTPAGWSSLEYTLPSIRETLESQGGGGKMKYVFPHAPTIGISINGGAQMPGWFDLVRLVSFYFSKQKELFWRYSQNPARAFLFFGCF